MEIRLENIKYRDLFDNLNVQIKSNEIMGVIGKNGSGKTSILNLIYGLDQNFDGEIKIGKNAINKDSKRKGILKVRNNITYLKQNYDDTLFSANVFDAIKYGSSKSDVNKLKYLIKLFNLSDDILDKNLLNLSNSELKKILIIKVFIQEKSIILLDDITNGLDSKDKEALIKLLKQERRNNKSIVVTSIDSEFLLQVVDRILILDGNKAKIIDDKYRVFTDMALLNRLNVAVPQILNFKLIAQSKNIKLAHKDNVNDLIKDIYRNVRR